MRKAELDMLNDIESVEPNNKLLNQGVKTVQQQFMLTYASIHFLKGGVMLPSVEQLQLAHSGSFSEMILSLKCMKHSIDNKKGLEQFKFGVIEMLMSWLENLETLKKNKQPKLLSAILCSELGRLPLQHYEELFVYFSYISRNAKSILKSNCQILSDDLLQMLSFMLPRLHYNIILPQNVLGGQSKENQDFLFYNESIQFFVRTQVRYRSLVRTVLKTVLSLQLRQSQTRELVDRACRYYLLFYNDDRMCAVQLFLAAFEKAPEAVRFSLSDQLIVFFKMAHKIGANSLEQAVQSRWEWTGQLIQRFGNSVIGQQKDEANPFSPLGIQQTIHVPAGKKIVRTIQIFHQFSLLYFWLTIENHNISMSIIYLGDFQSKVDVRKILAEEKLANSVRSTFVATKRGIYQLELDNSTSWINSKTMTFQYVVLAQHQHQQNPAWLDRLLQIGERVQVEDEEEMEDKENKEKQQRQIQGHYMHDVDTNIPKQKIRQNAHLQINMIPHRDEEAKANFTLTNGIFDLHIATAHSIYEFDTTLEDRLLKRLKTYADNKQLKWTVNSQARQWLNKQGYCLISKGSSTLLITEERNRQNNGKRVQYNRSKLSSK